MKRFIFPIIALFILVFSSGTQADSVEIGNTTLELLSNTSQCLTDCEAWLRWDLTGSLSAIQTPTKENSLFKFELEKLNPQSEDLLDFGVEVWSETIVNVNDYCRMLEDYFIPTKDLNVEDSCEAIGCLKEDATCRCTRTNSVVCGSHKETKLVKVSDNFFGFTFEKEIYQLRVWGKRKPTLVRQGIDWIPTFEGTKIGHWAWWSSSWSKKRQLTVAHASDLNAGQVVKIESVDVSGWNLNNLDEIRIVDENTLTDLSRHIVGTIASTDMNIYFVLSDELLLSDSPFTHFYVYYGNGSAGHVDDSNYTGSFDTFEDNDFLRPTWSDTTNATVQGAVVRNGSFAMSQTADSPWATMAWSADMNYDIEQEITTWFRTTNTAAPGYGGFISFNTGAIRVFGWIVLGDIIYYNGDVGTGYQAMAGAVDNTWYRLTAIYNHSTDKVNAYVYDFNGTLAASLTGRDPDNTGDINIVRISTGDGTSTMYVDDMFFGGYVSAESVGASEMQINVVDVNIVSVDGYSDAGDYPSFSYLVDGNLSIDFNVYNVDNNTSFVDVNYSTVSTDGSGTPIVSNLELTSEFCPDQNFTTPSTCTFDWNILNIADGNYFVLIALDSNAGTFARANTSKSLHITVPKLSMYFLDENTGKAIQGLSVTIASTTYTTDGTGLIDINIGSSTPTVYTVVAWQDNNYGTRYFEFDVNKFSNIDENLAMLRDINGQVVDFIFYDSDETTLIANKRIYLYYNGLDANIAGIRTTNASGETSLFMNPDRNYYFIAEHGDGTLTRYDRVKATFKIPKDEDTLVDITPFDVKKSGIGLIDYAAQNADIDLYLFSNTVSYYQFDTNGGNSYLTRKTVVKYRGNPATATIQVYLPHVDNGVESVFFTKDTDLSTVPGVRIVCFKNIEGAGTVEVQSVITDDAGTATMSFIIDDLYSFDVYDEDGDFVFSFELRPNFVEYFLNLGTASLITTPTEIEYIYVLGIPNERYIAFDASGYDINITVDVNKGTLSTSWFTIINDDGNVTFNDSCGSGCSYHLELTDLNNTMTLTVVVFVETESGLKYLKRWTFIPYDAEGDNLVETLQSCEFKQGLGCDCDPNIPCFFLLLVAIFLIVATMFAVGQAITTDRSALGIIMIFEMAIFTYFTWIPIGFFILAALAVFAGIVLSRRGF